MPSPIEAWRRLPAPVRFLACHAASGFGLSALFVGGLVLTNPGDAGTLLLGAADHPLPLLVLWIFTGLTFGAVQMGTAVMGLGGRPVEHQRPRGGSGAPVGLVPVRVRARRR